MSTDLAVRTGSTELSIEAGQIAFNAKQIAALRQLGVKDATNGDLAVFFHQAVRTGLDPFARQIYMIARWTKDGTKQTIQTGIDGYRLIARRAANRAGEVISYEDTLWCGHDGQWTDVWLSSEQPAAAKVVVLRNGGRFPATALWREYVQTVKDGSPNAMWSRMGAGQLAKCAEALALRKAFPQDLSGIYTEDEMPEPEPEPTTPVTRAEPASKRVQRKQPDPPPDVEPTFDEPEPAVASFSDNGTLDTEGVPIEPDPITPDQLKLLHIRFKENNLGDRDDALAWASGILGREVETSKALNKIEASMLIEALTYD